MPGRINLHEVIEPMDSRPLGWVHFVAFYPEVMQPGSPEPRVGMKVEVRFPVERGRPLTAAVVVPAGVCTRCGRIRALVAPFRYDPRRQEGASGYCRECDRARDRSRQPELPALPDTRQFAEDREFGRLGERLVERVCREQGLCVVPFGMEHAHGELRKLARSQKMRTEAGEAVRAMPDLAVYWAGDDGRTFWLVEVKTRQGDPLAARLRGRPGMEDRWLTDDAQLRSMRRYWPVATLAVVSFSLDPDTRRIACVVGAHPVAELPEPRICGGPGARRGEPGTSRCIDVHSFAPLHSLLRLDRIAFERSVSAFVRENERELRARLAQSSPHRCTPSISYR